MPAYQMKEITGGGKAARYMLDGVRVSREEYSRIERQARMFGRLDCMSTECSVQDDGTIRRVNYATACW